MATAINIQESIPAFQVVPSFIPDISISQHLDFELNWRSAARKLPNLTIDANQRLNYVSAMRRATNNHQKTLPLEDLQLACALAEYLADGSLLYELLEKYLTAIDRDNENYLEIKIKLALKLAKMGQFESALTLLEYALLAKPFDNRLVHAANTIQAQWLSIPYDLADCRSGELMLIPLTTDYLSDFCWQYADPSISELCNLPQFSSNDQWYDWLNKDNRPDEQKLFAVLHKDWGFIGSVSIEVFQGVGFFYYWLGADFQGKGFGPQAVDILLSLAEKYLNMDCCYAKVYQHNQPSHKAMAKLGFNALTIEAKTPYDNEIFYYCGPKKSNWGNYQELAWLLQVQYSMTELEGPKGCLHEDSNFINRKLNVLEMDKVL